MIVTPLCVPPQVLLLHSSVHSVPPLACVAQQPFESAAAWRSCCLQWLALTITLNKTVHTSYHTVMSADPTQLYMILICAPLISTGGAPSSRRHRFPHSPHSPGHNSVWWLGQPVDPWRPHGAFQRVLRGKCAAAQLGPGCCCRPVGGGPARAVLPPGGRGHHLHGTCGLCAYGRWCVAMVGSIRQSKLFRLGCAGSSRRPCVLGAM